MKRFASQSGVAVDELEKCPPPPDLFGTLPNLGSLRFWQHQGCDLYSISAPERNHDICILTKRPNLRHEHPWVKQLKSLNLGRHPKLI